jgi:hypothetical protein
MLIQILLRNGAAAAQLLYSEPEEAFSTPPQNFGQSCIESFSIVLWKFLMNLLKNDWKK